MQRRDTKQRREVLAYLRGVYTHPRAEDIHEHVQKMIPNITLATVYRNLHILQEEGKVNILEIENQFRFDGHTDKHYHLICNDCKKIFDVDKSIVKKPNMPNFHIYDVMLKGLCKRCQKHYN
jgi:Fe2+ or Zn2+ uptake regulation protein